MLGSPEITPYDLRFRFLAIPVRVHPLFWLIMLFLSGQVSNSDFDLTAVAVFVACAFISILVHEFGHGLAGRLMGDEPQEIVLYAMGGYCAFQANRLSGWRRLYMLAWGPGAGFVLFGLVVAFWAWPDRPTSPLLERALSDLWWINLIWGILNLFPLWPLDGGQMVGTVLTMFSPRNGMRWAHTTSLLVAGCLSALLVIYNIDLFMAFWFGYFAFINYRMLQAMHYAHHSAEDAEWWRR